jgi:hypothetical protein
VNSGGGKLKELEELKEQGKIADEEQYERDTSALKTTIHTNRMNIIAFREVIDGIVWRYLDYNRPILYMLADKQPIDLVSRLSSDNYRLGGI